MQMLEPKSENRTQKKSTTTGNLARYGTDSVRVFLAIGTSASASTAALSPLFSGSATNPASAWTNFFFSSAIRLSR